MADYKLSHTAAEIDDKLSKVQDGGTGYTEDETIHHIDQKYLPGVCLPLVELSTVIPFDGTEVELSAEEGANLSAACSSGLPVCLKCALGTEDFTIPVSAVPTFVAQGTEISLAILFNGTMILISFIDSTWTATMGA